MIDTSGRHSQLFWVESPFDLIVVLNFNLLKIEWIEQLVVPFSSLKLVLLCFNVKAHVNKVLELAYTTEIMTC